MLQVEHSATLFGAGCGRFHFENIHAIRTVLSSFLKITGLQHKARTNCSDYRIERVNISFTHLPDEFDGYRILQLSDLHADALVDGGSGIIDIITGLAYDLAVITGDYRFKTNDDYIPCLESMRPVVAALSAPDGCYGILGNHDFLEIVPGLEDAGLRILLNEQITILRGESQMILAGVDDPHFYGTHDIERALGSSSNKFIILLAHSPELAQKAACSGVSLYLCGHTHGGQICLPGRLPIIANASCTNAQTAGLWKTDKMSGYTSRGTGFSTVPARFFCPPEITLLTLRKRRMSSGHL